MSQYTAQEKFNGGEDIQIPRPHQGNPWLGINPQLIDRLGNINPIAHRRPFDTTRPVDRDVVIIPRLSFATQESLRKL